MATFRVARTETVHYVRDFTEDELIELGVAPEVLADLITYPDFESGVEDALTEATERYGDVQGNQWSIRKLEED